MVVGLNPIVVSSKELLDTQRTIRCSEDNNNEEIMNASFVSENGEVIGVNISVIDKDTPIYPGLENEEFPKGISRQENIESTAINLD